MQPWCHLVRPKSALGKARKNSEIIIAHDDFSGLEEQALRASRDVILASRIRGSKLQSDFSLGEGRWLPRTSRCKILTSII